jgi:hypothetical protein
MSSDKPLPFVYQFIAGAVAGVSEVRNVSRLGINLELTNMFIDSGNVMEINLLLFALFELTKSGTRWMSSKPECKHPHLNFQTKGTNIVVDSSRQLLLLVTMPTPAWSIASGKSSRMRGMSFHFRRLRIAERADVL